MSLTLHSPQYRVRREERKKENMYPTSQLPTRNETIDLYFQRCSVSAGPKELVPVLRSWVPVDLAQSVTWGKESGSRGHQNPQPGWLMGAFCRRQCAKPVNAQIPIQKVKKKGEIKQRFSKWRNKINFQSEWNGVTLFTWHTITSHSQNSVYRSQENNACIKR